MKNATANIGAKKPLFNKNMKNQTDIKAWQILLKLLL